MIVAAPPHPLAELNASSVQPDLGAALEAEDGELARLTQARNRPAGGLPRPGLAWPANVSRISSFIPAEPTADVLRRYLGWEGSLEQLVLALYCGDLLPARAESVVRALWGDAVDVTRLCRYGAEVGRRIETWLQRPLSRRYPYVFLQTMLVKAGPGGTRGWQRVFVALGVSRSGLREVLAVRLAAAADGLAWNGFFIDLRARGLGGPELFIGGQEPQFIELVEQHFPGVPYQADFRQMEREILQATPPIRWREANSALAAIRRDASPESARARLVSLHAAMRHAGDDEAAARLALALPHLHAYADFPRPHWPWLRTSAPGARVMRDCRELMRGAGAGATLAELRWLVAARWRWATRVWARQKPLSFDRDRAPRRTAAPLTSGPGRS